MVLTTDMLEILGDKLQLVNGDTSKKVCAAAKHYLEILALNQVDGESL